MKRIKTQNIPAEFQTVETSKTKSVEVSGEDFKKALQTLVGEEVLEEQKTVVPTESDASIEDEEEVEIAEVPWNLSAVTILPDRRASATSFTAADQTQIDLPQPIELVMPEMMSERLVTTVQLLNVEAVVEQANIFAPENVPEMATEIEVEQIPEKLPDELLTVQPIAPTESVEKLSEVSREVTILDTESDIQAISLTPEKVEKVDPRQVISIPESVKTPTTLEEFISQMDVDVKIDTKMVEVNSLKEVEASIATEPTEKMVNTDISASGQLTQMKLAAAQPQAQTEVVKVVPQEQVVQEIETIIVENVDGTDQVDRVSTTRIQLTPKHLGELEIELVMKNKELTARLVVEKAETKQWLEQKLVQLTNTLAEQDIKVEQFDIEVSNKFADFTESSFNDNPFFDEQEKSLKQRHSFQNELKEEKVTERVERNVPSSTGRLSLWV